MTALVVSLVLLAALGGLAALLSDRRRPDQTWRCTSCGRTGTSAQFASTGCGGLPRSAACPLELL